MSVPNNRLTQFKNHFEKFLKAIKTKPVWEKYEGLSETLKTICLYKAVECAAEPGVFALLKENDISGLFTLFGTHMVYDQNVVEIISNETEETRKELIKEAKAMCIIVDGIC
jgi:hypothetical protein